MPQSVRDFQAVLFHQGRVCENSVDRSVGMDLTIVQHDDSAAQLGNEIQVVRRDDDCPGKRF